MHVNMSLFRDGKNAFYDEADPRHLSPLAYQFIAGLLGHVRGCCAVTNPLVNSYKRLVPGYEAPCHLAWSTGNRSALVRIPTPRGNSTRVELRSPDPACNPYLALAACLAAGLDGIEQQVTPPAPLTGNLYKVGDASGIQRLPGSLEEAVRALEADSVITDALGAHVTEQYLAGKRRECGRTPPRCPSGSWNSIWWRTDLPALLTGPQREEGGKFHGQDHIGVCL